MNITIHNLTPSLRFQHPLHQLLSTHISTNNSFPRFSSPSISFLRFQNQRKKVVSQTLTSLGKRPLSNNSKPFSFSQLQIHHKNIPTSYRITSSTNSFSPSHVMISPKILPEFLLRFQQFPFLLNLYDTVKSKTHFKYQIQISSFPNYSQFIFTYTHLDRFDNIIASDFSLLLHIFHNFL